MYSTIFQHLEEHYGRALRICVIIQGVMPRKKKTRSDEETELVIKRYGNRRLYNTETQSYVNYKELTRLVRDGQDIKVIDSTTKEDVTKAVLIQMILEEEKNKKTILPTPFLFQLLRSQEESVQDFFKNHLAASFEAYLKTKEEFDKRFRSILEMAVAAPQMWEKLIPGADVMKDLLTGNIRTRSGSAGADETDEPKG
jgi:polyhydroxyalkanoate synthesis repressor PhaR